MNALRLSFSSAALLFALTSSAQSITSARDQVCAPGERGVHVAPLYSDSTCSSFLICIDTEVKPHIHRVHTEHVFVLDGEAIMRVGDLQRPIKAGDTMVIPAGTAHSVKVTSSNPLRVVSVQSPRFDGSDRVFVEP